jgi:hypothetical protein
VRNISLFYIQKSHDSVAGKVTNFSLLKNGTFLVGTRNEIKATVLLKTTLLGSQLVPVERRTSLYSSR